MIIWGGEPPAVEDPNPRFGAVLSKLNKVVEAIRTSTDDFNSNTEEKINSITTDLTAFIASVSLPVDAHLNAKGTPQHHETKASIGLAKRDNFRTATVAETTALSPVQAFVTPLGAKSAIQANLGSFSADDYQQNDLFQFASFYYPDEYPITVPTAVEPVRYLGPTKKMGLMFNDDRLVFSPFANSRYQTQSLFSSMPTRQSKGGRLSEVANLSQRYLSASWNTMACDTNDNKVAFFKALADKKVYSFANNLNNLPAGNRAYLFYSAFASLSYKGLAVSSSSSGTKVTLNHRFFYVDAIASAPALTELITSAYLATFDRMDTAAYSGPASGSQTFDILSYLNLPAGASLTIGGGTQGIVTSLCWNLQDSEAYLHVAVPVTVTLNGVSQALIFSFVESIKPGTLLAGGSATFTQLGTRTKDSLDANLNPLSGANWFKVNDPFDLLNPVQYPGVILHTSGELVKSISSKAGVKVKRATTSFTDISQWMTSKGVTLSAGQASRELYCPARHAPFGLMPERIIPYAHSATAVSYLVYGQDPSTGRFEWRRYNWSTTTPVGVEDTAQFGLRLPDQVVDVNNVGQLPGSLLSYTSTSVAGVNLNGLVFNDENGFKGLSGFAYDGVTLTPGTPVTLNAGVLNYLRGLSGNVLARAAAANPSVDKALRVGKVQVIRLTAAKALVVISDGLNYAEAGIANWSLSGSTFILSYPTGALVLSPVTPGGQTVTGKNRVSRSGDDVWLPSSDTLVSAVSGDVMDVVLTRPFDNSLYGDISFRVSGVTGTPVFTPGVVNPARLYAGTDAFDTVDELYPALLIPQKGLYQYSPSNTQYTSQLKQVSGTQIVDGFDVHDTGYVRLPAGCRLVMNGRTIILDKDYSVKVGTSGTVYCYLRLMGGSITVVTDTTNRQPVNNEVLFGIAVNGILTLSKSYIVMYGRVLSATRHGGAIPCFLDDGVKGVNQFFTKRDVKS